MSAISLVSFLVSHISSVSVQVPRSVIGSGLLGCIVFLTPSVPGLLHAQLYQRVNTISSREVTWHEIISIHIYFVNTHMLAGQPWGLGLGTVSPALCWTMFKFLNIGDETLQRICFRKLHFWVREEKADTVIVWQSLVRFPNWLDSQLGLQYP